MIAGAGVEPAFQKAAYETAEHPVLFPAGEVLAAATRFELVSSRLQDERSGVRLSYAAEDVFDRTVENRILRNGLPGI